MKYDEGRCEAMRGRAMRSDEGKAMKGDEGKGDEVRREAMGRGTLGASVSFMTYVCY